MTIHGDNIHEPVVEKLCAAYRAAVADPPFAATDEALLRAAARGIHSGWVRPTVTVALLVVVLGVIMFAITPPRGLPWAQRIVLVGNAARYLMGGLRHAGVPLPSKLVPYPVSSQSSQEGARQLQRGAIAADRAMGAAVAARVANPRVSRFLAEPLKAAQAAMKAAREAHDPQVEAEELEVEIQELQVAAAATSQKTPYDEYLINAMLGTAYAQERKWNMAAPALQAAAESPYATVTQRHAWLHAVVGMYYNERQYAKVIQVGNEALQAGVTEREIYQTIWLARRALGVQATQPPAH